jgi:hypothetical protein
MDEFGCTTAFLAHIHIWSNIVLHERNWYDTNFYVVRREPLTSHNLHDNDNIAHNSPGPAASGAVSMSSKYSLENPIDIVHFSPLAEDAGQRSSRVRVPHQAE